MPKLYKLICSIINALPIDINFDLSQFASFFESILQNSQQSNSDFILNENDNQSNFLVSQKVTTLFTQTTESAFKKSKNQRTDEQRN